MYIRLFIGLLLGSILGLQAFNNVPPTSRDPYGPDGTEYLMRLANMPRPLFLEFKLRHAQRVPVYDLGLFGNSRIMSAHQDGLQAYGRVFNFFVPGSSLRTSVGIAEWLAEEDRLPSTLIFMVTNFAHNTQQVQVLPIIRRLQLSYADVVAGITRDSISTYELARMTLRHLKEEYIQFTESLSINRIRITLALALGNFGDWLEPANLVLHEDGSGLRNKRDTPIIVPIQKAIGGTFLPGYFLLDLERLSRLPGAPRIIIYESPLEPNSERAMRLNPPPWLEKNRRLFLSTCSRLDLECFPAPMLGETGQLSLWRDANHPPDDILIAYLIGLLDRQTQ